MLDRMTSRAVQRDLGAVGKKDSKYTPELQQITPSNFKNEQIQYKYEQKAKM